MTALAEAVHVEDGDKVFELIEGRFIERLPDGAFGHFAVAENDPNMVRQLVEILAVKGHTNADGQALAERAGGHVHIGQNVRIRVSLESAAELAEREQFLIGNGAGRFVHGVEDGAGVALAENEAVVVRFVRRGPVVAEIFGQQHGHEVGFRHGRSGMSGTGRRGAANAVDSQLGRQFFPLVQMIRHDNTGLVWVSDRVGTPRSCLS